MKSQSPAPKKNWVFWLGFGFFTQPNTQTQKIQKKQNPTQHPNPKSQKTQNPTHPKNKIQPNTQPK
jgi:hypothetical protein